MIYRKAMVEEIPLLAKFRIMQLNDEGIFHKEDVTAGMIEFFEKHMNDDSLVEWVVEDDGRIIATAAILFHEYPPTFTNNIELRGYVTNIYTSPEYRKKGIATSLLNKLIEEAKQRGAKKLWLGASEMGRPVYEKFGFAVMSEWMDLDFGV